MAYEFDIYLAHAWEDKAEVRMIASDLQAQGFRVWYDDDQLESGRSLRAQLDEGMRRSQVGVIVLSRMFFSPAKYWAPAEFDAWIDAGPQNRIVVVWLDVDKQEVRSWSPIAATLFARRYGTENFIETLSADVQRKMIDTGMYAAHLRSTLEKGLHWYRRPEFFMQSMDAIETEPLWVFPDYRIPSDAVSIALTEVFSRPSDFAGSPILVVGHVRAVQVLGRAGGIQEFALQVTTVDERFAGYHLQCVTCKISNAELPMPSPPSDTHLATICGWVVGRGSVQVGRDYEHAVLFFASDITFMDLTGQNGPPIVNWLDLKSG